MTVAELLTKPENWCQETNSKDKLGNPVEPDSENSHSWCLYGAVMKCYGRDYVAIDQALEKMRKILKAYSIIVWNDEPERTHEEVLELVKKAGI